MSQNPFDFSDFRGGATPAGTPAGPPPGPVPGPRDAGRYAAPPVAGLPPGGFGGSSAGDVVVSRPPLRLLWAALALALVGGVLAAVAGGTPWIAVTAWVLAGPAAFATLGAFSTADTRQRARSVYAAPSWLRAAYGATAVVAVLAVVVTALRLAEWVGRL